jgi:predicted O-linked N-acetylglucosamine transferase (SPINDLY family)
MPHKKHAQRILNQLTHKGVIDFRQLHQRAAKCVEEDQFELAAELYRSWMQRHPKHAHLADAGFLLGKILSGLENHAEARDAFASARDFLLRTPSLTPVQYLDLLKLHVLLGEEYVKLDEKQKAIESWRWVVSNANTQEPTARLLLIEALNRAGDMYDECMQQMDVIKSRTLSLGLDPEQPILIGSLVGKRREICQWPIDAPTGTVGSDVMHKHMSILHLVGISDDPELQLATARRDETLRLANFPDITPYPPTHYRHERIRIAYASSDFRSHPVSRLVAELFELHDRERFDIYALDWSKEDESAVRQRIINAFGEHFIRIDELADDEVAELIHQHEIDVLIDLHGSTINYRPGFFAHRPAPFQITFLGMPATTGITGIDYVLADRFLIPEEMAPYYTEKPLYLPEVFQPCDRQRTHEPIPTRAECGLPAERFVFCCFNSSPKFTPEMLDSWARILARTPGSVLWLAAFNPLTEENLRREATQRGIAEDRLIFAQRTNYETYLSFLAVGDLFLDTFPFNGGATANDVLWMGLPILTLCGRCFGSRMGGALLSAAGLDELITYNLADYEDKAVALAQDPEHYRKLRTQVAALRDQSVIFDMPRFTHNLESVLTQLVRQQES